MYLVKVISQDRKNKVFVKAGLLDELISEGCRKPKLADLANTTFQVCDCLIITLLLKCNPTFETNF